MAPALSTLFSVSYLVLTKTLLQMNPFTGNEAHLPKVIDLLPSTLIKTRLHVPRFQAFIHLGVNRGYISGNPNNGNGIEKSQNVEIILERVRKGTCKTSE